MWRGQKKEKTTTNKTPKSPQLNFLEKVKLSRKMRIFEKALGPPMEAQSSISLLQKTEVGRGLGGGVQCCWLCLILWKLWVLAGSSVHVFSTTMTGVGCHSLLQGVFLTHGLNRTVVQILYHLSRQGVLEWFSVCVCLSLLPSSFQVGMWGHTILGSL